MTRLAVLSDIHGNLVALQAVLDHLEAQDAPDVTWVLGDLSAFCPWPSETLDWLRSIPEVAFLRGNTDRYLVAGRRPATPSVESPEAWREMPARLAERDANFRWTVERLSYDDYVFLRDLPTELAMDAPGYGRVVAFHANPRDDETFLPPDAEEAQMADYFSGVDARLVLYGHTHRPVDRAAAGVRIVNVGSVGLPLDGDPRSAYALLDFEGETCQVSIRRMDYDRQVVIDELAYVSHPAQAWVSGILRNAST
jgi:predicted phosphodiesterase